MSVALIQERPSLLETDHLILDAKSVGVLQTRLGEDIIINHPVGYSIQTLAERGLVDCVIADTEDGFSQLGMMRHFLSEDLGLIERNLVKYVLAGFPETLERNISSLADWNRFQNPKVTLVAIPTERQYSHLRGLILVPHDRSESYKQYAGWDYGRPRPHRDFIYNVTYEAIAHAYKNWGARRIGITHYSYNKYHRDLTTCQVEAMTHFCSGHKGMESFTFLDDFNGNQPLEIVKEFNELQEIGIHRSIITKSIQFWGIDFVDLDWTKATQDITAD